MADDSIRVKFNIDTANLPSQMQKIVNSIKKAEGEVERLRAKMDALKNQKIPTQEYADIQKQIADAEKKLTALTERQEKFLATGGNVKSSSYERMNYDIEQLRNTIKYAKGELEDLVSSGKAFTLGGDSEEYARMAARVEELTGNIEASKTRLAEMAAKQRPVSSGFESMRKSAAGLLAVLGGFGRIGGKAFGALKNAASKAFSAIHKGTKKSSGLLSTFASRLKGITLSLLIFNWITKAFNAMISGMKKGFENLMGYSAGFANSVQSLKNSMATLGNQFAAAFAPIVQMVIPWLRSLINALSTAMSYVAQFIALLGGKNTFTRAKQIQDSYNKSLGGTASAAKKAYGALAKFDDLDVLQKQEDTDAGGGAGETLPQDMFEEVPIDPKMLDFFDKVKDILSKLFAPLKEAWDREGKFVMDSWKYALDEVWNLIKDIGRDFLTVWNQEKTIQMLADILHIIGDIGLIIGNVAHALDEAWNKNQTGLHILENIRDIFAAIIHNIREAADYTVKWSAMLDFSPLLESIQNLTGALVPFADFVSGTLEDFYIHFILPLISFAISEDGLPRLVNILADLMNSVDWEGLRKALINLYIALEPYAEAVAEGFIDFLEKMKNIGVAFINSLPAPILALADAFKSGNPEDVRRWTAALLEFVAAIEAVKIAFKGFEKVSKAFVAIKTAISAIGEFLSYVGQINPESIVIFGSSLVDMIRGTFLDPFEWDNVIGELLRYLSGVWERLWDGVYVALSSSWETFKSGLEYIFNLDWVWELFDKAKQNFIDAFNGEDIGTNILQGLFNGISAALGVFLAPIVNLFSMIIEGILELFGIHSPSTVFAEIGQNLILGLLQGIQGIWASIVEFFQTKITEIRDFFVEGWTGIQEWFSEYWAIFTENLSVVWENIKTFFFEIWSGIQENASVIWTAVKDFFSTTWEGIKANASTAWNAIKTFFQTTWTNIQTIATTIWTAIKTFMQTTWENVKTFAQNTWTNIKTMLTNVWDTIKEKAVSIWESIRRVFEEKINAVRDKMEEIKEKFDSFREKVFSVFENIKETVVSAIDAVKGAISGFIGLVESAISAIGNLISKAAGIGSSIGGKISGFLGISAPTGIQIPVGYDITSEMANKFDIPHLASGSVIQGGRPFAAILGDQPRGQVNIEAPLATIEQAVENTMSRFAGGTGFGGTMRVVLNVNGSDLAQVTLNDFLSEMNRQGYDVSVLGVT